ncbi:hypothetical protein, partial [Actinoplanes derwentensis]|uniref:hypothetical protein n=1 Tax=Actinoplanes derwentensis TaxID=113562 RepID=UPI0019425C5B
FAAFGDGFELEMLGEQGDRGGDREPATQVIGPRVVPRSTPDSPPVRRPSRAPDHTVLRGKTWDRRQSRNAIAQSGEVADQPNIRTCR